MKQKITGFHQDEESHWVADLECGHAQHMRHDPPWQERDWVLTPETRREKIGIELNCVRCDEAGLAVAKAVVAEAKIAMTEAYENAGISGLCAEGRWELALDSLRSLELKPLVEKTLQK